MNERMWKTCLLWVVRSCTKKLSDHLDAKGRTMICFVLFCFVLFCSVLFCFVLFCFVLFCFVLFCS